ncbi:MAG: DUF4173 domain-containing protein [Anaerolineales bacterium]
MKTNPTRFWTIVILLGWAFDLLFWEKPPGINFAIYLTLCLATGILLLNADGLRLARRSSWLLLPIAFLAAVTFIRLEPLTIFLSGAMALFLMGVLALTYLGARWLHYSLVDYIFGYFRLLGSMIARPLGFAAEIRRNEPSVPAPGAQAQVSEKRAIYFWPILRGIVIALPVIAIFASLLSSADPIFATRINEFIELFNLENLPEYIFRMIYILLIAYVLAGTLLHAAQSSDEKISEDKPVISSFLGFTESTIVLGGVIVLFVSFVIIQLQYFFGGQANVHIEGYTFSEYARKGFGELVAVAFFSLLLLLGLGAITRRDSERQRRMFSSFGVSLVGLVLVMLVSAFQRLMLYEQAYGFSRLRTYTHVFMIWLAILLVSVVLLELLRRERVIGLSMVLVSLGFVISLSLLNVDAFIVRQNIQREIRSVTDEDLSQGRVDLDAQYFLDLSDDAVPALAEAFLNKSLPEAVREKIGAALACKHHDRGVDKRVLLWQSFHFSRFYADRAFAQLKKQLDSYKITDTDWPVLVETPGGEELSCWPDYYD